MNSLLIIRLILRCIFLHFLPIEAVMGLRNKSIYLRAEAKMSKTIIWFGLSKS